MWFHRKPSNRRMDRAEVLDVRLRTRSLRAARWRLAGLLVTLLIATIVGSYACVRAVGWLRREVIYDNQAFALNTIDVHTDGWIPAELVRQWTGLKLGDNLLALDLGRIQRDLKVIPQVEAVSVERVLPHQLILRVTEREPVARVRLLKPGAGGDLVPEVLYLDEQAMVMPPVEHPDQPPALIQALESLPVVRGVSGLDLEQGRPIQVPKVHAALLLLAEYERSPIAAWADLRSVDVSLPESLLVTTTQGAEVTFGLGNPARQLLRWHAVHEAGLRLGKAIASLDLSVTNNCPVLWREATATNALPAVRTKALNPLRKRK